MILKLRPTGRRKNFLRRDFRPTLSSHANGVFRKRFSNRRNLKTAALRFCVERKHLKTKLFENHEVIIITCMYYENEFALSLQDDKPIAKKVKLN